MNKPASTLSIRLQLPPDDEDQQKGKPDEVIYLWDRIILAGLAAAVVVVGIVAGAWYALSGPAPDPVRPAIVTAVPATAPAADPSADSAALATTKSAAADQTQVSSAIDGSGTSTQEAAPANDTAAKVQPAIGGPAVTPLANAPTAGQTTPAELGPSAGNEQSPKAEDDSVETASTDRNKQAEVGARPATATTRAPSPAVRPNAAPAGNAAVPAQQPAKVEVLSDHLLHAQLSNRLVNRTPLDQASAVIPMNEEGLVTVYFYTELQDLQGETVYYNWYRDDKRVARVRARPQRPITRAYSSKFIDRHMLGQWRVELDSADGETLARAEFEIRDAAFAANPGDSTGS